MKLRVLLLAALFAITAMAMPAQAKDCGDGADDSDECKSSNGNSSEKCEHDPEARKCVREKVKEVCNIIIIHGSTPQIGQWDPILGILEFRPDQCYEWYVEAENGNTYLFFRYDGR